MTDFDKIEWITTQEPVPYERAVAFMEQRVAAIFAGEAPECIWLLEHPPLYTAGTSARESDLLTPDRFPVYKSGRGGEYTYHGPGQRIVYVMLDLNQRVKDVRWFVTELESWVIDVCAQFGVKAEIRDGRVGLWVERELAGFRKEEKIAAIGIRMRRWVSFHGISINVDPDLEHFSGIVPCGISDHGVTSFSALGRSVDYETLDMALKSLFTHRFQPRLRTNGDALLGSKC